MTVGNASPSCPPVDRAAGDLLVLTDADRYGRSGLTLPFRDATVVEAGDGWKLEVEGRFDTVVVDRQAHDAAWLDGVLGSLVAALRPGGRLIVALHPRYEASPAMRSPALPGLAWQGFTLLGGRTCAVLTADVGTDADESSAGPLISAAESVLGLVAAESQVDRWLTTDWARASAVQQAEDRRRSERALLLQIAALTRQLDEERRRHQGTELVKTILRRSRSGRLMLRVARRCRQLVRKTRSVAGRGRRKLRAISGRSRP